jgi:hypothetical protein
MRHYDEQPDQPTFDDALREMQSEDSIPSPVVISGLSNIGVEEFARLKPVWESLDATYKRILMQMLADVADSDFEFDYSMIGLANLNDEDGAVRQAAIEILQHDESPELMNKLSILASSDPELNVRIEATRSLGRFVLLAEWEEISQKDIRPVQEFLANTYHNMSVPAEMRGVALESLANSSYDKIVSMIESAYRSQNPVLTLSAITAMGRTCDERWESVILRELESRDSVMIRAAIRAAGEIQSEDAVPILKKILKDANREDLETIIWSLGEIGGKESTRILEQLLSEVENEEDEELLEWIDDAIGNASIASGDFKLLDFDNL